MLHCRVCYIGRYIYMYIKGSCSFTNCNVLLFVGNVGCKCRPGMVGDSAGYYTTCTDDYTSTLV